MSLVTSFAATYYIDYASGNDANAGTSKPSPWKRHPYMQGWTGSYVHANGDQFIFKGGVTWPRAALPTQIALGGTSASPDYYGVDLTWFDGASFTKPKIDGEDQEVPGSNNFFDLRAGGFGSHNVIIDGFEFTRLYWTNYSTTGSDVYVGVGVSTNVLIINCLFTNWTHGTFSLSGDCSDPLATHARGLVCVFGDSNVPHNQGSYISNCVFDSGLRLADPGADAVYIFPTIRNSIARNVANGFLPSSNGIVSGCTIGPIIPPGDAGCTHDNAIEAVGGGTHRYYNNIIHASPGAFAPSIFTGGFGSAHTNYIWNNVIWEGESVPIGVAGGGGPFPGGGTAYIWNNTVVQKTNKPTQVSLAFDTYGSGAALDTLVIQNNLYISDHSSSDPVSIAVPVGALTKTHNVKITHAQATAAGYTIANRFAPTSLDDPSVGVGTNAPSVPNFSTLDRNGSLRTFPWDVGADQFSSAPAVDSIQLVENSYPVSEASGTVTIQIERLNPDSSTASITFQTVNATAVAPGDYISTNYTVAWAANVGGTTNITLAIVNDSDVEGDEFFTGFLSGVSGAAMSNPTNVTVTILDNDTSGIASATGLKWQATNMTFGGAWESTNGYLRHTVESADPNTSIAKIKVTIPDTGWYSLIVYVNSLDDSSNSVFSAWDLVPTAPQGIADTPLTTDFTRIVLPQRGDGAYNDNQHKWHAARLTQGDHTNFFCGREKGLQALRFEVVRHNPEQVLSRATYRMQ